VDGVAGGAERESAEVFRGEPFAERGHPQAVPYIENALLIRVAETVFAVKIVAAGERLAGFTGLYIWLQNISTRILALSRRKEEI